MQHSTYSTNGKGASRMSSGGTLETLNRSVRRHWMIAAALPVLVIAGTAVALYFMPRIYEANAQLRIDQQKSNLAVLDALTSLSSGSAIETEMVVLRSRTMAESVTDSLALRATIVSPRGAQRSEYFERLAVSPTASAGEWTIRSGARAVSVTRADGPGEAQQFGRGETLRFAGIEAVPARAALEEGTEIRLEVAPHADAVRQFQRTLSVGRPNREADVVQIGYASTDSVMVRDVVNTVVRHFIRRRQQEQSTEAVNMVTFLNEQIDTLTFQLTNAEEALRDYSEQSGIVAMSAQAESYVSRLADLKAQRDIADAERRAIGSLIEPGGAASGSYRNIVGFHTILRSPSGAELLRTLNEAENVRAEMLIRYTPEAPEVVQQTERIEELEAQLRGIATTYLSGLNNTVSELDTQLAGYDTELRQIPEQEIRLARLRRHAELLEEIHTLLQTRVKEAEIAAAVHDASVRIVDPAIVPSRPARPRPKLSLAFATVLGLGLGIAGAVLRDHADRTVRTREELQHTLPGLPILSVIPRAHGARFGNDHVRTSVVDAESPSAEAYRQLRTNLSFARPGMPQQVLVMTSPTPGDGKSMTSMNLAATLAQQGSRCILIDADMRRGALNEVFEVPRDPGLSQLLIDQASFEDAVRSVELPERNARLDFMSGGVHPPNPAELLGSARFKALVEMCREKYDAVIIDAPPLNLVTDASVMGAAADGVIVVVRAGVTRGDALGFAIDQLEAVRAPLLGVILNDVNLRSEGYYGKYAGYYGREQRA